MAYNPLTKLLLKFNESSGSTASADTSDGGRSVTIVDGQVSSANGKFGTNSLEVGDPYGSGVFSYALLSSPAGVWSTSRSSVKRFDCWYYVAANQTSGISPIVSISFANNDTFSVWRGATGVEVEINSQASPVVAYNPGSYSDYQGMYGWHHLRFVIDGPDFALGIDGTELIAFSNSTTGEDLWVGDATNPITEVIFGSWPLFYNAPGAYFRGYLDAIEFTEGDTSWLGGSYTVPTAEPDDYVGGGAPELFGDGASTLDDLISYGTESLAEIEGAGEVTLDDVQSECLGTTLGALSGSGANEVDNIESVGDGSVVSDIIGEGAVALDDFTTKGIGGGKDITTTLMLHCNTGQETLDSSAHALTVTGNGTWSSSANSWLNGAVQFQKLSGFGGYFSIPQQGALFANPATEKIIDFRFIRLSTVGTETIFSVNFDGAQPLVLTIDQFGDMVLEVPGLAATTVASNITFSVWRHVRVAVIGDTIYVCLNGVQVYSAASPGSMLWPQNNACTGFAIGQVFPPQSWAGLNAGIDEFRIQEGFFADHGYAGGNFTLPTYEWFPGQVIGNGSNTVTVESVGEVKEFAENFGQGSNTVSEVYQVCKGRLEYPVNGANVVDDVASYGHVVSGVYISAFGATTVEELVSIGHTEVLPVIFGQSAFVLADVTSEGVGGISWSARGANAISVASEGFGVGPAWHVGSGKNTVANVTSQGTLSGPRTGQGSSATNVTSTGVGKSLIRGDGANTVSASAATSAKLLCSGLAANSVEVSSQGAASAAASGYGQANISVVSVGVATMVCRGYGSGNVSVTSAGTVGAGIAGYATALCGVSSSGAGAVLIQGYGAGYVGDVFTRQDYPDDAAHLFVLTRTPRTFATQRHNTITVRGSA